MQKTFGWTSTSSFRKDLAWQLRISFDSRGDESLCDPSIILHPRMLVNFSIFQTFQNELLQCCPVICEHTRGDLLDSVWKGKPSYQLHITLIWFGSRVRVERSSSAVRFVLASHFQLVLFLTLALYSLPSADRSGFGWVHWVSVRDSTFSAANVLLRLAFSVCKGELSFHGWPKVTESWILLYKRCACFFSEKTCFSIETASNCVTITLSWHNKQFTLSMSRILKGKP